MPHSDSLQSVPHPTTEEPTATHLSPLVPDLLTIPKDWSRQVASCFATDEGHPYRAHSLLHGLPLSSFRTTLHPAPTPLLQPPIDLATIGLQPYFCSHQYYPYFCINNSQCKNTIFFLIYKHFLLFHCASWQFFIVPVGNFSLWQLAVFHYASWQLFIVAVGSFFIVVVGNTFKAFPMC